MPNLRETQPSSEALPERFRFNPAETELATRAVGNYALSSLRSLEANWPVESFHAVIHNPEDLKAMVDGNRDFLDTCSRLMDTIQDGEKNPQGVELTSDQLVLTMNALFRFGVHTSHDARLAAQGDAGRFSNIYFMTPKDKEGAIGQISVGAVQARELFKKLEPIAISHNLERMIWDEDTVIPQP